MSPYRLLLFCMVSWRQSKLKAEGTELPQLCCYLQGAPFILRAAAWSPGLNRPHSFSFLLSHRLFLLLVAAVTLPCTNRGQAARCFLLRAAHGGEVTLEVKPFFVFGDFSAGSLSLGLQSWLVDLACRPLPFVLLNSSKEIRPTDSAWSRRQQRCWPADVSVLLGPRTESLVLPPPQSSSGRLP